MLKLKKLYKTGFSVLLVFALLMAVLVTDTITVEAASVMSTIPSGTGPIAIAVNPMTNRIYQANYVSDDVTVIDGTTNTKTTVAAGDYPRAIAVNPETNKIYIANYGSSNVTVIDCNNNNSTTTVAAGTSPYAIAVDPTTNKIYVANSGSGNMTVINGTDLSTQTIAVGVSPYAVAVDPVTNKIYVANYGSSDVTVINGTDLSTQTVAAGSLPYAVAVNPISNKIYVANSGSGDVTVIDGAGLSTQTITAGSKPQAITVNPETNNIYVANFNSNNVTVIDGDDNSTIPVVTGIKPQAIAVNPATNKIYLANIGDNNVTVINGDDNSTVTIAAGSRPMAVAVNPITNRIYTANYESSDMTVIDGDDNKKAELNVSSLANDVAVNPVTNKIYVANGQYNNVTVVNRSNNSKATVATGLYPQAVAVNPITNKIYVANRDSHNVTVIDGMNLSTQTVAAGEEPCDIAVNPATNKVYVVNRKSCNITVIDGANLSTQTLNTQTSVSGYLVGTLPTAVAVNPATNKIYVGDDKSDYTTVIDGANFSMETIQTVYGQIAVAVNPVTNKIYVGSTGMIAVVDGNNGSTAYINEVNFPEAIAVNPATNKIYATNFFNDTVTVIDGADNSKAIIAAGEWPDGIDVNPVTNEIYVSKMKGNSVSVIDAQSEQQGHLNVSISSLPENLTEDTSATFDLTAQSTYTPSSPGIRQIWYQMDTITCKWMKALPAGASAKVTLSGLSRGTHTLYAFATDGMDATTVNTGYGTSSITGKIAAYSFTVLDTRPVITTQSLPGTALQDDYNMTVSAKFGLEPYTWNATSLPAGLSINTSTGLISGLPEESGNFHPTISMTDRDGVSAQKIFTLSVYDAPDGSGTLVAAPAGLDAGSKGNLLTFTYTPSGSGLYNGEISLQLPAGWTLPNTVSGSEGYVSATAGTVSISGSTISVSNIILPLSDSLDITYSDVTAPGGEGSDVLLVKQKTKTGGTLKTLSTLPQIVVNPDITDPTWPGGATLNITGRAANTITFEWPGASDNIGVAGYRIYKNGSLEATVEESVNSYTASGLSEGISYTFMVSAYDMAGNTTDGPSIAANTNTSMTITMDTIPEGETDKPYSFTLTAGGGTTPYIWAATGLPSGLGIDSATGKISGTPSDEGVNSVTAALIDSEGQRVSIVFNIVIKRVSMQITTDSLSAGTAGALYSQTLKASGGDGHYTWLNKEIPAGLSLNSATGEINGRVQESGIYTVNIVLIDGSGETTEKTYQLVINAETAKGKYNVTPDADSAYIIGSKNGIVTVTIKPGVTGYKFIAATVTPVIAHEGAETAVFTLTRGGIQIGLTAVKADFDYDNHPTVGFNMKAGDIVKIVVVDDLSNGADSNPVLLQ